MTTESRPTRTAAMTATATTLVALVAVASTAAAVAMPRAAHGHGQAEARSVVLDTQTMRCMAEAFAAAARDLLTSGQQDVALPTLCWSDELELPEAEGTAHHFAADEPIRWLLGERLLDLPPPAC